jgi:secreted trypsin-like serine protease
VRRAWSLVSVAAVVLLTQSAWGIVRRDDVDNSLYIGLANQPQFAAVGKVLVGSTGAGSGTVIANGWWVLTAAHVVFGVPASSVSFQIGAATYNAQNVYIYPGYSGITHDIALIELNAPVAGVTPAQIYTGTNEIGKQGHSVGYGLTGTGTTGFINNTYGTKRAMRNIIDLIIFPNGTIDPNGTILLSDFDSPAGTNNSLSPWGSSATPLDLEGMGAPGDSGGPVFILEGGVWYIAGVHSFIGDLGPPAGNGQADARYGDILGSTRVSSYAGWINSVVPEPASMTALAIGLIGLLARRRRSR